MNIRTLYDDPVTRRILEERAQALARQEIADDTALHEETLTFQLGDGRYSVLARFVREVQALGAYTPLPGTPPFVIGLVNLRGRLLAALDIRPLLELPATPPQAGAMLLIATAGGTDIALLADTVIEVRRSSTNLTPSFRSIAGQAIAWVQGVDSDLTVRIDLAALLADPNIIIGAT
jgi:purine-binding chemotaxis protein CheW